ncbi:hypothetical protein NKH77_22300 [Streptomyces sp. M19]
MDASWLTPDENEPPDRGGEKATGRATSDEAPGSAPGRRGAGRDDGADRGAGLGVRDPRHLRTGGRRAAPTRDSCRASDEEPSAAGDETLSVRIYLVCASQVRTVVREIRLSDEKASRVAPVVLARELLDQLRQSPPTAEAGRVRHGGRVPGAGHQPGGGRPDKTIRLNIAPDQLRSYGLVQIICTFGHTTLGDHGKVILGGPERDADGLRQYQCTEALRARPESVLASGCRSRRPPPPRPVGNSF